MNNSENVIASLEKTIQQSKVTDFGNPTMISETKLKTDKFGFVYYKRAKIDQDTTQCEKRQKALQKRREKYKSKRQAVVHKSSVEKEDQEQKREQLLQRRRERYRVNRSAILEKSRQTYMFKKQKQKEDYTFTTCRDVKNKNEQHCLNHVLDT